MKEKKHRVHIAMTRESVYKVLGVDEDDELMLLRLAHIFFTIWIIYSVDMARHKGL